jgi:S1-C subfamily serine protease
MRHAVFSIVRMRPTAVPDVVDTIALGSGFFVSPNVLMSCQHVFNSAAFPHQDGDIYRVVANVGAANPVIHDADNVRNGVNLHCYADADLALLEFPAGPPRPFVALDYATTLEGREIGVAGYPLGRVVVVNGQQGYKQMIFRVARGVVTATYSTEWTDEFGTLNDLPVVEVNFMFVPGNSGGPVFDARSGRVIAFVKGFKFDKIMERAERFVNAPANLPAGLGPDYIASLHSIYSYAVKMERARPHLEAHGITL